MEGRRLRRGRGASGRALAVAALGPGGARGGRPAGGLQAGIGPLSTTRLALRSLVEQVLGVIENKS